MKHGKSKDPIYRVWHGMKGRCLDPHNHSYNDYGRRSITVCLRWLVFENFYEDMGDQPPGERGMQEVVRCQ
jgi:hypothetical protein